MASMTSVKIRVITNNSIAAPGIGRPACAERDQLGELQLDQGQLDAERDRDAERAERGRRRAP